ncbi:hypothetical protein [Modestobacter versicolor]|uniref:LppX_LprAFG lipoprotein n=1 Tax=Modestobacter versicolor TaxID=429133 RepID=A0A323V8V8_9ACTN|nr:hypothetical protein [Modestobacter versicolor]MBB3677374.1 hypothetical protein [Modestobacter versicolor]PZA21267.1 hypothetical protein DMO24_11190 [Modestobacter versicolor]
MRSSRRPGPLRLVVLSAVAALVAVLAGCSGDEPTERRPGDAVTSEEAAVLAEVLYNDLQEGGADFEVSAPFAEGALLTLTGEVDFSRSTGRAQAVTTYSDGQPEETRTLFFTESELWQGDVPGLAEAVTAAGLPAAGYARRPIAATDATGTASLLDVLVQMVTRLSARSADDPRSFEAYTWGGTQSVNGQLASVFRSGTGAEVTVAADSRLLVQYATTLQDFRVTITLDDHGQREITLPADTDAVDLAAHPEIAAALGL